MKILNLKPIILVALFLAGSVLPAIAQEKLEPRPSPLAIAAMKKNDTYIKITYSRPHKKGRDLFGSELVPYGQVWRTGANETTEITVTSDIQLAGNELPAGTYSIFTIPNEDEWTIILNKGLGQWGAYDYNDDLDFMRFKVPVGSTDTTWEPFTIQLDNQKMEMRMMWGNTQVTIPISI